MKVGLDLDNCQCLTNNWFLARLQALGVCEGLSEQDMTDHALEICWPEAITRSWVMEQFADVNFWLNIPADPNMVRATRHLARREDWPRIEAVHVVTARYRWQHPLIRRITADYLAAQGFQYTDLHLCETTEKAPYAVRMGLDLFVEDRRDTAYQIAQAGIPVLLVALPYNQLSTHPDDQPLNRLIYRAPRHEIAYALSALGRGEPLESLFPQRAQDQTRPTLSIVTGTGSIVTGTGE